MKAEISLDNVTCLLGEIKASIETAVSCSDDCVCDVQHC